jgi:hypothetical protein
MAETSVINRIAIHATAESSLPTRPAKGANIAKSAWTTATFSTIGSVDRGSDDADLADENIQYTIVDEAGEIVQTRGMQIDDIIDMKYYISEFSIVCEDMSEALWTLVSNVSVTSNVATFAATSTPRAVAIETNGLGIAYFPKCRITISDAEGGFGQDGKGMTTLRVQPMKPSSGEHFSFEWYQAA